MMIGELYDLLLDSKKIGTTKLEKADAPMGIVFGSIAFDDIIAGYEFIKTYCLINRIEIIADLPEDKLIVTSDIPNLQIVDRGGIEIKGQTASIDGMDNDGFVVTILGIPYPYFEEMFPHHVEAYKDQFKNSE